MPKRSPNHFTLTINNEQASSLSKKQKVPISSSINILSTLPKDEFGIILRFLTVQDLIEFSQSSRKVFEFIKEWMILNYPLAVEYVHGDDDQQSWIQMAPVFEIVKRLPIDDMNFQKVSKLFKKIAQEFSGNFNVLTQCVDFVYIGPTSCKLYDQLLNIPIVDRCCHGNQPVQVVLFKHDLSSSISYSAEGEKTDDEKREIVPRTISSLEVQIGFTIKCMILNIESHISDMYDALSYCQSLEKLTVIFGDSVNGEAVDESFECPVLYSLKQLSFELHFITDDVPSQKTLIDILKLTPNLECLDIYLHNYCDANILQYISRMCPNLKKLEIDLDQGYGTIEMSMTDGELYEILKALPKLEHLVIGKAFEISGEIYSKIGEFPQLVYFNVQRGTYNRDLVPQVANFHFGGNGGMLPKLKHLSIGRNFNFSQEEKKALFESLLKIAPNLESDIQEVFNCW